MPLSMGQKAVEWIGNGFGRLYEGLPKLNFFGKKFPNPGWLLSLTNFPEKLEIFHKERFSSLINQWKKVRRKRIKPV